MDFPYLFTAGCSHSTGISRIMVSVLRKLSSKLEVVEGWIDHCYLKNFLYQNGGSSLS